MEHLTVTCVKPNRGFLHIYGHKKPELLDQLNAEISAYKPSIKQIAAPNNLYPSLEFDTIYLALAADTGLYHRCTVREKRPNNRAIIDLIDYGNDYEVDSKYLLELNPKNAQAEFLKDFPPIVTKFILAKFFCTWKTDEISVINTMLFKGTLPITNEQTDRDAHFISLSFNGVDLATKLISARIGMEIAFTEQRLEVRRQSQRLCDVFEIGPKASPARREKRRNLVPNRPLQMVSNNNNTITSQGKRMIQNMVMSNVASPPRSSMPVESASVVDGAVQSAIAAAKPTTASPAAAAAAEAIGRIPAFTATDLALEPYHAVYCSYVEDGPNLFWVQLKSLEHVLDRMASQLANAPRNPISTKLSIGMACIARYSEDHAFYRAVIQKIMADGCRVTFVDYGNSEFVAFDELYEIPNQFLELKTFAWSFQLRGCKQLDLTNKRLIDYFKAMVENENVLDLKVIPANNFQVQQCDLFVANGRDVLTILTDKMAELSTYPAAQILKNGDMVVIRTALGAKRFFVQRLEKMAVFDRMMDDLFQFCRTAPPLKTLPAKGMQCAAMANGDSNEWYRAIVVDVLDDARRAQVQFVDYGMEMVCNLADLRAIDARFLEMPRQAIECCLVDFENLTEVSEMTSKQLAMLTDDSNGEPIPYKASVRQVRRRAANTVYIVDLYDEKKDLSVSLSVYKLAMPRRPYSKPVKPAAAEAENTTRPMPTSQTNGQALRECDGAESQEKFQETPTNAPTEGPMDRYTADNDLRADRTKATHRNDNAKAPPIQAQPKTQGNNRTDSDNNRRYSGHNDQPKNVDKNDNYYDSTVPGDSSLGVHVDVASKSTENGLENKPAPAATAPDSSDLNSIPEEPTPMPAPEPVATNTMEPEVEIEESTNKTTETIDSVASISSPTHIDLPNVTESTAEMVSMTTAAPENESGIETPREQAYITHVDHPGRFYMQLNSDSAAIVSLCESLQIVAPQLPTLNEFHAGRLCVGKFSLDDCWYRAKIIYTDNEITSIRFIDYGNTDSITNNALLKTLAPDDALMTVHEPFAIECSLPIAPHGHASEWPENASEKLRSVSSDQPVEFETISKYDGVNYVKVFLPDDRNLVREMIDEGVADPLEIVKSGEECYVSHINSLRDFYIQVESDSEVLRKVESHLDANRDAAILEAPSVGAVCSAKYEDDNFYRARIFDIPPEAGHYHVEFLDYGNTFMTDDVRTLHPEIAQLPHLRKRCELQMPNGIHEWSAEAEAQFRTVANFGETAFKVHLMKPGKVACVDLCMDDGVKVSTMLGELCEKQPATPAVGVNEQEASTSNGNAGTHPIEQVVNDLPSGLQPCLIAYANGPEDFFIHLHGRSNELDLIAAELANQDDQDTLDPSAVEVGSIVAALYPDDGCYYRAKVLERLATQMQVAFIDYGNVCAVTQVRKLPSIIQPIVPLAVHCTLSDDTLKQFTPEQTNGFVELIHETPEPTFHVEAISTTAKMATVTLYRDGKEILDYMRANTSLDSVAVTVLSDILEEAANMSHE